MKKSTNRHNDGSILNNIQCGDAMARHHIVAFYAHVMK